jgi:hypothetical protein
MRGARVRRFGAAIGWVVLVSVADAQVKSLAYVGRYERQSTTDHMMGVESVFGHYALVASNLALTIVDVNRLPAGGTTAYVDRLPGLDAYTTHTRGDGVCFVNLRLGGFAVVQVDPVTRKLELLKKVDEPGVYYDKMAPVGDRLYVAAHSFGLRIFDVSKPALPRLVGSLPRGLDDAFAVAVSGTTAYVADGAGGLKVVDVSDESAPFVRWGESPDGALATAQDVLVDGDRVYVASGGTGVAVYSASDLSRRTLYDTPICAKQLALSSGVLAVADTGGFLLFGVESDGSLTQIASEKGMRRSLGGTSVSMRVWSGISIQGVRRILVADWDTMDVYDVADPTTPLQADVTASSQRLRFAPAGGSSKVQLVNQGTGPLVVTNVHSTGPGFSATPTNGLLQPGETLDLTITYDGSDDGEEVVLVDCNDPDENPLPIQVFGRTATLDPTERAAVFDLDSWTFDHTTRQFKSEWFDLAAKAGQVAVIQTFGTW